MKGSRVTAVSAYVAVMFLMLAAAISVCACGGSASSASTPSTTPTPSTAPSFSTTQPNLPSPEVVAALEGRIAAMNDGDGAVAAAFYAKDGVLEETDLTPHAMSRGREELAARFNDLYDMGLRLAPAGAPIAYDRYVAEPTRFYNGNEPGKGAGMLVFQFDAANKIVHQWAIGWVSD